MNQDAIEILAANAVTDSIAICEYLSPFINEKDKIPLIDGNVLVYDNIKENRNIIGSVLV